MDIQVLGLDPATRAVPLNDQTTPEIRECGHLLNLIPDAWLVVAVGEKQVIRHPGEVFLPKVATALHPVDSVKLRLVPLDADERQDHLTLVKDLRSDPARLDRCRTHHPQQFGGWITPGDRCGERV
jgi:hypothetical protein